MSILVRPKAQADLDAIFDYISDDSESHAEQLMVSFGEKFQMLSTNPLAGRARPELFPEIRSFPFRNYVIFYFSTAKGIEVARVLHGARDIAAIFDDIESIH